MVEIPLIAVPSQGFQILLNEQECTFSLYQRGTRLFMDLDVEATRVFTGAVCLEGGNVVRVAQARFKGSLHFVDTLGCASPQWEGLGTRWLLIFFSPTEELPARLRY